MPTGVVSDESTVTDSELSLCRLWIGFESSMGVEGGKKQSERAKERGRAALVAREENDGHVLRAPLSQRPRSIVRFSR